MAYRRSIIRRVGLLRQRFDPSFSYILHEDDDKSQPKDAHTSLPQNYSLLQRGYHSGINSGAAGINSLLRRKDYTSILPMFGPLSCNYSSGAIGGSADKIEYMKDMTDIITEKGVELVSQAPVVNEVAIAAADSYYNVAALQYLIDGVHSFTGLNWWASIALTTILIRGATVPLLINQLKASSKLALMRPELEELKGQMQNMGDPKAISEAQQKMNALFKKHGVTPFTPLKGMLIQGPIFVSFFFAIRNMAEKVPSFKEGGALWFTDLTTPDALYIFPIMTALTFLINVELNMQEGMEGNPMAGHMKTFSRVIGVLTVPFTMSFPKAIFCYWITSNFFSTIYGCVLKRPDVKKYLNLPAFPATASSKTTAPKPAFDLISAFKQFKQAAKEPTPLITDSSTHSDRKVSPSSVMSQRLKTLEKQVKGRKKNKRR
ncbi:mitochondrial inner membrane protein OXA1-like [Thalictrum thalictroides]|uniref:Mitochondrial inner membrane protein OXA1-like n=1 Tax=Thalictrum thalictroides TaxID=46969 RepID=A0A7J6VMB8_THATH|nr:mitochondrial inner membrane protein OXA1-like [Thalictrum thalictroides]